MEPRVKFRVLYGFGADFLNYIVDKGFYISDINSIRFGFTAVCNANEYIQIARRAKQFQCRTKIIAKKGIYFKIRRYLVRKGLIAGVVLFPLWCFVFSNMIWKININTADPYLKNEIANFLFNNKVYAGVFYPKDIMDSLKRKIMIENDKVSYIAFNFYKGILNCEVYSGNIKENYTEKQTSRNIYAQLSGVITDLRVYSGFSKVSLGQSVSRGDILVSNNTVNQYNFASTSDTSAYVEGICTKIYSVFVPFEKTIDIYTGKYAQSKFLYFMGREYMIEKNKDDNWEKYSQRTVIRYADIFGFRLPLTTKNITYYQMESVNISSDLLTAQTNARMQLIHLTDNDLKLKKEISRRYDYAVMENGINASCMVEGYYDMT